MIIITTKYLGPTNVRGSRIKATRNTRSVILEWDDIVGSDENHRRAANAFIKKYNSADGLDYPCLLSTDGPDGAQQFALFRGNQEMGRGELDPS